MRALSTLAGFFFFVFGTVGVFMLMSGNPLALLQIAEVFALIFAPLGIVILHYGYRRVRRTFSAAKLFVCVPRGAYRSQDIIPVLNRWILATYLTSGATFLGVLVLISAHFDSPAIELVEHLAMGIVIFMWAFFICEAILRPLKTRILTREEETQATGAIATDAATAPRTLSGSDPL